MVGACSRELAMAINVNREIVRYIRFTIKEEEENNLHYQTTTARKLVRARDGYQYQSRLLLMAMFGGNRLTRYKSFSRLVSFRLAAAAVE